MIATSRLRSGNIDSAHGAPRLIGEGLAAARRAGSARFSITALMDPGITAVISRIPETASVGIKYPHAIWEDGGAGGGYWVSDVEVAETTYTAFTSRRKAEHITARLIVRRVKRLNPKSVPAGQVDMFSVYRHHAAFADPSVDTPARSRSSSR